MKAQAKSPIIQVQTKNKGDNIMYCTFYRPTKIDTKEFENIVGKLHYDLFLLETRSMMNGVSTATSTTSAGRQKPFRRIPP